MIRTSPLLAALALAGLLAAGCGSSGPAPARSPARPAVPSARAAGDCSKLAASALPLAAYDQLLTAAAGRIAHGGTASAAQEAEARAAVAAEVRSSCPQFAYLIAGDQG